MRTGTGPFFLDPETPRTGTGFIFQPFLILDPDEGVLNQMALAWSWLRLGPEDVAIRFRFVGVQFRGRLLKA